MKVKMQDYERIYKTINAILLNEGADPTVACMFFSVYGSYLLSSHYKIDARPVAGLCMYHLGGNGNVLTFGEIQNGQLMGTSEAFHCWIVADGWLIDFMAPTFPKLLKSSGQKFSCLPKMMQKPISSMAPSASELIAEGDFYFEIEPHVTKERLAYFTTSLAYSDLAEICNKWYRKPPRKMQPEIQIGDGNGSVNSVLLVGQSVVGAW